MAPPPRQRSSGSPPRASPTWWIRPWPWRSDIIGQATTSAYRRRGRRARARAEASPWRRRCCRRGTWSRCCSAARRWRSRPTPRSWSGSRTSSSRSATAAGPARSRPPSSSSSRPRPGRTPRRRRRRTRTSSATCSPASCRAPVYGSCSPIKDKNVHATPLAWGQIGLVTSPVRFRGQRLVPFERKQRK